MLWLKVALCGMSVPDSHKRKHHKDMAQFHFEQIFFHFGKLLIEQVFSFIEDSARSHLLVFGIEFYPDEISIEFAGHDARSAATHERV